MLAQHSGLRGLGTAEKVSGPATDPLYPQPSLSIKMHPASHIGGVATIATEEFCEGVWGGGGEMSRCLPRDDSPTLLSSVDLLLPLFVWRFRQIKQHDVSSLARSAEVPSLPNFNQVSAAGRFMAFLCRRLDTPSRPRAVCCAEFSGDRRRCGPPQCLTLVAPTLPGCACVLRTSEWQRLSSLHSRC